MSHKRQGGCSAQHDPVAGVGSNFRNLTLSGLFQAYLSIEQLSEKYSGDN